MKVAIVYDRVNKWGGAERVLLALNKMFPEAPLYTSVYNRETARWADVFPQIIPSFLQKIPFASSHHEYLAPLMPLAFESFDFTSYERVISVTSESAKGIITTSNTKHVCICLTPTRYLWSGYDEYFQGRSFEALAKPVVNYLRRWDKIAAQRPDVMIAISSEVQDRIKKYYGRDSKLVFPPVELRVPRISRVSRVPRVSRVSKGQYFLLVSRLVAYKRVDLVIKVFNKLGITLVIIGKGSEEKQLKKLAKSNITFVSDLTDEELVKYYSEAKALIMPQFEDFGLVAVEAQLMGTPVIAYARGGVKDSIIPNKTGILFQDQTSRSLINALKKFEVTKFNKHDIIRNAKQFSFTRFARNLTELYERIQD